MSTPLRALSVALICAASLTPAHAYAQSEFQLGPAPRATASRVPLQDVIALPADGFVIDVFNRQAVVDSFTTIYLPALSVPGNWTGNVATCDAGSTTAAYADATIQMVNFFRAMTRLPGVTHSAVLDQRSQQAALMMTANNSLNHSPPTTWACYTAAGAEAAGRSNLASGVAGAASIASYMYDPGANNTAVGHRRWILFPPQGAIGTGSTARFNSLWVVGTSGPRPATLEWVSWPNAGFVPYQIVYPRWSFSVNQGGSAAPNFTGATVAMTSGGTTIPLAILPIHNGYGDNTIVWEPSGVAGGAGMADRPITVTISNVLVGGAPRSYTYAVTIIDPGALTPPAAAAEVGSPTSHVSTVTGSTVTLRWNAPVAGAAPSSYIIQVGSLPGESNIATVNTGNATTVLVATGVPNGTYHTRVRGVTAAGASGEPSNDTRSSVGSSCVSPAPPAGVSAAVSGRLVMVNWNPSVGAASYIVEAGSASGLLDFFNANVGGGTAVAGTVSAGVYFIRVRTMNACGGISPVSVQVMVQVS